ncbi:MAG: hypothetical protein ACRDEA_13440 [Microcystaceae cyanobacterium]
MIITDLEHLEVVSNVNDVEGSKKAKAQVAPTGLAQVAVNFNFLSLGVNSSAAVIENADFLATSSPGVNISSGTIVVILQAT